LEAYLNELVVDQRGNRQGFPSEVLREILFVSALHDKFMSERKRKASSSILAELAPGKLDAIERAQLQSTPEIVARLLDLKKKIAKDDLDGIMELSALYNQRDRDGLSPLMHASSFGSERCMLQMIKSGANPHLPDSMGNRALHWAVMNAKLRATEILLYFGADGMVKNNAGVTPFSLSVIKPDASMATRLIDYGVDVNSPDGKGDFPLHKAVHANSIECVRLLLASGAAKQIRNRDGKMAIELASPELVKVFERHQAELLKGTM
jgi:hypothetical protein